jgi:hypothetical protein
MRPWMRHGRSEMLKLPNVGPQNVQPRVHAGAEGGGMIS